MKIMTIIGARPEIVQTAPVSRMIRQHGHTEVLVHTGQHYDFNMSDVFFADLGLPRPDHNLEVGSGSHAEQTGQTMIRLEAVMKQEQPDWVLVYGDTNSTVAGAMVAAKLLIPLGHIEAGLRSFDRTMPEEINRIVTDHVSTLLFAPTSVAVENLKREGIVEGVRQVGDVRVDLLLGLVETARSRQSLLLAEIGLSDGQPFALATIHRAANTDDETKLQGIVTAFNTLSMPVVLPVHPRLQKMMAHFGLSFNDNVRAIQPVGILDMVALIDASAVVLTDSGGLQKEAYMLYRPTVTVRDTTEWIETVDAGWNRLCEPAPDHIQSAIDRACGTHPESHPDYYGSFGVAERTCEELERYAS